MSDYYQEEPRWLSWLQVKEIAELELELDEEQEEERWAASVAKYATDESVYSFADPIRSEYLLESDHGYYSKATVDLAVEPPTGHDWVSSVTNSGKTIYKLHTSRSTCGLKLEDCYDPDCRHELSLMAEPDERNEFKQDWNSLADRPDENFMLGLPGLRYIESGNDVRYQKWNEVCPSCFIYTPKKLETCQNCDSVLAFN